MVPNLALPEQMDVYYWLDATNVDQNRRIAIMATVSTNNGTLTHRSLIGSFLNAVTHGSVASVLHQYEKTTAQHLTQLAMTAP